MSDEEHPFDRLHYVQSGTYAGRLNSGDFKVLFRWRDWAMALEERHLPARFERVTLYGKGTVTDRFERNYDLQGPRYYNGPVTTISLSAGGGIEIKRLDKFCAKRPMWSAGVLVELIMMEATASILKQLLPREADSKSSRFERPDRALIWIPKDRSLPD